MKLAFLRLWNEELGRRVLLSLYFIVQTSSIQQYFIRLTPTLITPSVFNFSNILLVCAIKHTSVNHGQWWRGLGQLVRPSLRYGLKPCRWWSIDIGVAPLVACSRLLRFTNDFVGLPWYQRLSSALSSLLTTAFKPFEVKM